MQLEKFAYQDKNTGWNLEEVNFEKLTLLVGASGVGKTKILQSILNLKAIAEGKAIAGCKWELRFKTITNEQYHWKGEFQTDNNASIANEKAANKPNPKIVFEEIFLNGKLIVDRFDDKIVFDGAATPKLSFQQSAIYLLKEEEKIKPAYLGFSNIIFSDQSTNIPASSAYSLPNEQEILAAYDNLEKIQNSDFDIPRKLFLAFHNAPVIFKSILDRYSEIFPKIEAVKIELKPEDDFSVLFSMSPNPVILLKEIGVKNWIMQEHISSGMLRSLLLISSIYLCSEGTVFLIDEFENSLGVNCIDELTSEILNSRRKLQFILTSHHPYIINNIDFVYWKVVTRNNGKVKTHNARELNLGRSKHDAFMQLLQLEEFQTGTMA